MTAGSAALAVSVEFARSLVATGLLIRWPRVALAVGPVAITAAISGTAPVWLRLWNADVVLVEGYTLPLAAAVGSLAGSSIVADTTADRGPSPGPRSSWASSRRR